ncbi:hypothetical protein LTR62_004065 [Meristemomyces frigidus]|uniref:Topoisomerase 1-associated factor 1 n=1 Tax=Meristemomyces frigidus TaxID=1508187 RepID=A0AAN7TJC4_9PEZI|nr:hypothetical protein LTR62_004065 [Meristemomyces frigidus]
MDDPWEKSATVDPEVRAYVYSLVTAVGGSSNYDDTTYQVGDDAYAALQDLTKWLRLYDEKLNRFDVKRCLAEANLVKGDLLEILALWREEEVAQEREWKTKVNLKLGLACLQLLVPLTWPMEMEEEKTTLNHHRHLPFLQLAQVGYKRAVLHHENAKILRTAVRIALPGVGVQRRERSRRDNGIIQLMLYLLRNVAMIVQPQMLPSQGDENEISRSATIDVFWEQDIFTLLLTVGSGANDDFQDQDVILLEILFHLLKGVDAKKLFMEQKQMQIQETDELQLLMQRERAMHKGYNRRAPSRHNRFGTMLWVKREDEMMSTLTGQASIVDGDATLQMMDQSKKWNKPRQRGRNTQQPSEQADFGEKVELNESARQHLREFVADFLDSGFNPLFSSLRKAIERETERVGETHKRQYFYLISWFLDASSARRSQAHTQTTSQPTPSEENTFAYIAAVLDQETFVLLNRNMQRFLDDKSWPDLQSTLLALTQILLTTQTMAESPDEEDQEIAENIQNRLFYEEATHDRLVQILRGYTTQGFAYLDTVTETIHVFVRMLEQYSKQNADLTIRSKRRARKKTVRKLPNGTTAPAAATDDPEDAAEEEERTAHAAVSERKFDFARFSSKLLSQPCVDTFLSFLHFYQDLDREQLKRCHRYLYRLAFKHDLAILLFRVDVLQLLYRMIKGPDALSTETAGFKDWETLVQQVFRRCIKWLEKEQEGEGWREMCIVEMLFSKIPATVFYLQNGYERVVVKSAPRPPAEMEVKGSVEKGMRVPVCVCLLLEQGKGDVLGWVKREFERAVEERRAWEGEGAARAMLERQPSDGGDPESVALLPAPPTIFLSPESNERKAQLFKDKYLRLLLTTLGCQRQGTAENAEASWTVPSEVDTKTLTEGLESIKRTEHDPPTFEEGKTAEGMVRNKSAGTMRVAAGSYDDEEDDNNDDDDPADGAPRAGDPNADDASDSGLDSPLFPPNRPSKRKQDAPERNPKRRRLTRRPAVEFSDADAAARAAERKRKERERNKKTKSRLLVTASDDESDSEADAEFFRLEEERRRRTQGEIRSALLRRKVEGDDGAEKGKAKAKAKKRKGKGTRKRKGVAGESEGQSSGEDGLEDQASEDETAARPPKRRAVFEEESDSDVGTHATPQRPKPRALFEQDSEEDEGEDGGAKISNPDPGPEGEDRDVENDGLVGLFPRRKPPRAIFGEDRGSEEDDDEAVVEEETPGTSPPPGVGLDGRAGSGEGIEDVDMEDVGNDKDGDEDLIPSRKPVARRGGRTAMVIEGDSDEE